MLVCELEVLVVLCVELVVVVDCDVCYVVVL